MYTSMYLRGRFFGRQGFTAEEDKQGERTDEIFGGIR